MTLTEEDKEFLAHYGILGMKWGVRRSEDQLERARARRKESGKPVTPTKKGKAQSSKKQARQRNRQLNKESRAKDRADRKKAAQQESSEILKARERFQSGEPFDKLDSARKSFKSDKARIGSREARKILRKAKDEFAADLEFAQKPIDIFEEFEFMGDPYMSLKRVFEEAK